MYYIWVKTEIERKINADIDEVGLWQKRLETENPDEAVKVLADCIKTYGKNSVLLTEGVYYRAVVSLEALIEGERLEVQTE